LSTILPVHLAVVPVGEGGAEGLEALAEQLARRFPLEWRLERPLALRPEWSAGDGRLHSSAVLDALLELPRETVSVGAASPRRKLWTLAVTAADLAAPDRTFVFGEAEVAGCCAVVSGARLRVGERLLKEAIHELGHVAGLAHCPDPECVMHPSAAVAGVDRKGADLCRPCSAALRNLLGSAAA
jgi:archaemetzincin